MWTQKKLYLIAFLFIMGSFNQCNVRHDTISRKQLFDLNWKFNLGTRTFAPEIDLNDDDWRSLDLPHDWSKDKELTVAASKNLTGDNSTVTGWYRKHFEIPKKWVDKNILIDFEGICDRSELFVNGKSLVNSKNGNNSFQVLLNPYLNYNGKNVIAIRVAIPKQPDGKWKADSGIYKHVWIIIKDSPGLKN